MDYKPWLNIQDVSSLGRSTRLKGIKTNRQHEFLSDLERNYFYITEYSDFVVDIREQFPLLPLEETMVIADELGIKHPTNPKESVEAYVGELTDIGERSFAFLDDGITPRKYIVAYVKLRNGKEVALLEIERAGRSVSTLIII